MKNVSLNLTPRAEEKNGHQWWALSHLPISFTKIQITDKKRQKNQQKIMTTIFLLAFYIYFFSFYNIGFILVFFLPWRDKCRCSHILWRLESDDQVKTNPFESTRSHGRCSKREIIGCFENFLYKKYFKCMCSKLTVDRAPALKIRLLSFDTLRIKQVLGFLLCCVFNKGHKSSKYHITLNLC